MPARSPGKRNEHRTAPASHANLQQHRLLEERSNAVPQRLDLSRADYIGLTALVLLVAALAGFALAGYDFAGLALLFVAGMAVGTVLAYLVTLPPSHRETLAFALVMVLFVGGVLTAFLALSSVLPYRLFTYDSPTGNFVKGLAFGAFYAAAQRWMRPSSRPRDRRSSNRL